MLVTVIFVHIFCFFSIFVSNLHVNCNHFDYFNFNNNLYIYLSFNQKYRSKSQSLKNIIIRFETKLKRKKKIMLRTYLIKSLQLTNRKVKFLFYFYFIDDLIFVHIFNFKHFVYICFFKFIVLI